MPSGVFTANAAWLSITAMAHNRQHEWLNLLAAANGPPAAAA